MGVIPLVAWPQEIKWLEKTIEILLDQENQVKRERSTLVDSLKTSEGRQTEASTRLCIL